MHVRVTAYTNGIAGQQQRVPGHAASRKVHSRAERRRFPASSAIPRLFGPLDRVTREGTHRRPPVRGGRSHELRSTARGAADAANRPAFRTPLRGKMRDRKTGFPCAGSSRGTISHVCGRRRSSLARTGQARRALAGQRTEAMTRVCTSTPVILRCPRVERASKDDGPERLGEHSSLHPSRLASRAPQDDGLESVLAGLFDN